MYVHRLSTTSAITFSDQLISSQLTVELAQATEKRANLQHVLKAIKDEKNAKEVHSHDTTVPSLLSQKDWLKAVQTVEDYIPLLHGIEQCLKTDDILPRSELFFTWKDTLGESSVTATLPGIYFELLNVLNVNSKSLANLAASLVVSVGDYERVEAATLDAEGRKRKEERLKFATELYCRAAGQFEYSGNEVIRQWESSVGTHRLGELGRSVEATREMCFALSRLSHAEAELLAIRKLLSPTSCQQTASRTYAPPLPAGHPSPSLLAKLYLNVAQLFESAQSLARTAGDAFNVHFDSRGTNEESADGSTRLPSLNGTLTSKFKLGSSRGKSSEDLTRTGKAASGFLKYVHKSARVNRARAHMWLGIDKGERGDYGVALGFIRLAREDAQSISTKSKMHLNKHITNEQKREQKRYFVIERDDLLKSIEQWSKAYTQLNDTVGFHNISPTSSLMSQIPAGRGATAIVPYKLPAPAFGPGSMGFVSEGMERLRGLGNDRDEHLLPQHDGNREQSYAGQGAYY